MSTVHPTEPAEKVEARDAESPPEKRLIRIKRFQIGLNVIVQFAIVLGVVLMVNYLAFNNFKRWDF